MSIKLLRGIAAICLTLLIAGFNLSYAQTTYYVDTDGSNANNGLAPTSSGSDGPVETIAYALTLAADNDIISIEAGTYTEDVTVDKSVTFTTRDDGGSSIVELRSLTIDGAGKTLTVSSDNIELTGTAAVLTVTEGTLDLQDNTLTITDNGDVLVDANGSIENNTPAQGGVLFTDANATIAGEGYSNIMLDVGAGNSVNLSADVTFNGNLMLLSGAITAGGATDISPVQDNQMLTINRQRAAGIVAPASFNNAELSYDLSYTGTLAANATTGNELTFLVRNLTISTGGPGSLIMPRSDIKMVNLTIETGASLQTASANQSNEITGTLTIQENAEIVSDAANVSSFELSGDNIIHDISGSVVENTNRVGFIISGDNVTFAGSGEEDANNNFAEANFTITEVGAAISGLQSIGELTVNKGSVEVGLIVTTEAAPNASPDYGVIDGSVTTTVADDAVTIASATQANGALFIADNSNLILGGNNLVVNASDITIEGADATLNSTSGMLVFSGGTDLEANGASIPYLSVLSPATATTNVVVTEALTVESSITGGGTVILEGVQITTDNVTIADLEIDGDTELLTNDTSAPFSGRTITVIGSYTHTSGNVELNQNTIVLEDTDLNFTTGAYTSSSGDGGIELDADTGGIHINTGGENVSVPNLTLTGRNGTTLTDGDMITIQYGLTLDDRLTVDSDEDGDVVISDGATITRTASAHIIDEAPAFHGSVNLVYDQTGTVASGNVAADVINTGREVPATGEGTINDVTVAAGEFADQLAITTAFNVHGNFSITGTTIYNTGANVTFVSGSSIELKDAVADFDTAIDSDSEDYKVILRTSRTIDTDTPDSYFAGSNFSLEVNNEASSTITGTLAVDSDTFKNVTVGENDAININIPDGINIRGDLTAESSGFFTTDGTNTITFSGTGVQTVNFGDNYEVEEGDELVFSAETVRVETGNITFEEGSGRVDPLFQTGVVWTGDSNYIQLVHTSTTEQGFQRTDGHVFGNVRKLLPAGGTTSQHIIFPVGGDNLDDTGQTAEDEYSPVAFTFANTTTIPTGIYTTVNYKEDNPGGQNGLPIVDGVREGVDVVRYPDEFYWTIKTSASLPSSLPYELELARQGYTDYIQSGENSDVEDLRIIRRVAGNIDNNWILLGSEEDYENYQTGTIEDGDIYPTVYGKNFQGGLQAGDGQRFTYGLKSTFDTSPPGTVTANVGQTKLLDLLGDHLITGGSGDYSYTVISSEASIATASVSNDILEITAEGVGETTISVTATDDYDASITLEVPVSITQSLSFKELASDLSSDGFSQNEGDTFSYTADQFFAGGLPPYILSASSDDASVIVSTNDDNLTIEGVSAGAAEVTIAVKDENEEELEFTYNHIVNAGLNPGSLSDIEIRAGDDIAQTDSVHTIESFSANHLTGGTNPVFTVSSSNQNAAIVSYDSNSDQLVVSAVNSDSLEATTTISVDAEDEFGETESLNFDVTVRPAYGDVSKSFGVINTNDVQNILNYRVGNTDFSANQLTASDVDKDGTTDSWDALLVFDYFFGDVSELPYTPSGNAKSPIARMEYGQIQNKGSDITVPLNVEGSGIKAIDFNATFDANKASIENLKIAGLPEGWVVAKNISSEGQVSLALVGRTAINSREIAAITFKLNSQGNGINLQGEATVNNNFVVLDDFSVKEIPENFSLGQNYPNPFNPTSSVRYNLATPADVTIDLYSISGQKIRTLVSEQQNSGSYLLTVDGSQLASGVYIYRIHAEAESQVFMTTKKMTLIK